MAKIKGMCAVIVNPDGDVVTEMSDFERSGYGGMSIDDAQSYRVRTFIKSRFFVHHVNGWLGEKVDGYLAETFWQHAEKVGYKMHVFPASNEKDAG